MAAVKPTPYAIATGAVAFAFATIFHKQLPVEAVAGLPAVFTALVAAFERTDKVVVDVSGDVAKVATEVAKVADKVQTYSQALASSHTQPFQEAAK